MSSARRGGRQGWRIRKLQHERFQNHSNNNLKEHFMKKVHVVISSALLLFCSAWLSAQTFTLLHSFDGTDGAQPHAGLIQGTDGNLYGTTGFGGSANVGTVFNIPLGGGTLKTLATFHGTNGSQPFAGLVQATDGNLYGTTGYGGADNVGTVFKIPLGGGTLKTLATFHGTNGSYPAAGLVQANDGNLYGTASGGGSDSAGTVFKIPLGGGALKTLATFHGTNGSGPAAGLIQATDGNLYGTTETGGSDDQGTVFKIALGGTLKTLATFHGTNGIYPAAGLVQADGNLYGTASMGGSDSAGTVFKIPLGGGTLKTLATFNATNGYDPLAGLIQATDGNLYGTTFSGGVNGYGTVFTIPPAGGTLTTLYSFCSQSGCTDGGNPTAGLIQATDGKLYGTTYNGGVNGGGTVFSLSLGNAQEQRDLSVDEVTP
jgi:uncharacterized repeat protein (TIGR03803 family)